MKTLEFYISKVFDKKDPDYTSMLRMRTYTGGSSVPDGSADVPIERDTAGALVATLARFIQETTTERWEDVPINLSAVDIEVILKALSTQRDDNHTIRLRAQLQRELEAIA